MPWNRTRRELEECEERDIIVKPDPWQLRVNSEWFRKYWDSLVKKWEELRAKEL